MRCAHCNREVKNPHIVLGMVLGSECQHLYAGLEGMLSAQNITIPQEFPMVSAGQDSFQQSPELTAAIARAASVGVRLKLETDFSVTPPVDTVTGIRSANPTHIASFAQTRVEFAGRLGGL